jgi:hypothetical protein
MNRRAFLAATAGAAILLTGCNQSGGSGSESPGTPQETPQQTETPTATERPTESPTEIASSALVSEPDYVMTGADPHVLYCGVNLTDDALINVKQSEDDIVFAGPLAFLLARGFASGDLRGDVGPFSRWKSPTAVKQTRSVTLVVPPAERDNASLWFGPAAVDDANPAITDGFQSVRFEPCNVSSPSPTAWTVWTGGFLAKGDRCVTFHVWPDGESKPREVTLSFGAGECE